MSARAEPGIRRPLPTDGDALGDVIFRAFDGVAREFSYRSTFPDAAAGIAEAARLLASRRFFGYVATARGRVIGGAFAMQGNDVAGIGPIVVRPDAQGRGVGRALIRALMSDVRRRGYAQARLQQDAPNVRSMTLYATEGFDYVDTSIILEAGPRRSPDIGLATRAELPAIRTICREIYGVDRGLEIGDALAAGRLLRKADGPLSGYLVPGVFGHGTAIDASGAMDLVQHAAWLAQRPSRFLMFLRQAGLYRWAIQAGCRPVKVMNLMSWGPYVAPSDFSLPSLSF
jgi:GNAT superfamily N-acetyltransferase